MGHAAKVEEEDAVKRGRDGMTIEKKAVEEKTKSGDEGEDKRERERERGREQRPWRDPGQCRSCFSPFQPHAADCPRRPLALDNLDIHGRA